MHELDIPKHLQASKTDACRCFFFRDVKKFLDKKGRVGYTKQAVERT